MWSPSSVDVMLEVKIGKELQLLYFILFYFIFILLFYFILFLSIYMNTPTRNIAHIYVCPLSMRYRNLKKLWFVQVNLQEEAYPTPMF